MLLLLLLLPLLSLQPLLVLLLFFPGRSSYFYTPRGGAGRGIRMRANFEILSEFGLYVELSNKTTTCVFFDFQKHRNRVGGEGDPKAQTPNCIVFASRGPISRSWKNAKT